MKKLLLLFMLICLHVVNIVGQDVYSQQQELADMLMRDEFFKARKQRQLCGDSIDKSLKLCYAFKMHGYLNRPDSSAIYLERMLKDYPNFFTNRETKVYFINELFDLCAEMGNYSKMLDAYNIAEQITKPYLFSNDSIWAKQQLIAISQLRREVEGKLEIPQMKVTNLSKKKETSIAFTEEPILTSVIKCNGVTTKTWIDTGCEYAIFMTKAIADKCNIKDSSLSEDSLSINGARIRAHKALIDSLRIGSIQFSHIPAVIVHGDFASFAPNDILSEESQDEYDSIMNSTGFVIGLPILKKLGSILLDWDKKKIKIKLASDISRNKKEANMFLRGKSLYTQLFINSVGCIGVIDTGALRTGLELTKEYYITNKTNLPIDETQKGKSKDIRSVALIEPALKYDILLNPQVVFGSKTIKLKINDVIAWQNETTTIKSKDGLIGYQFLKRLGSKVTFDFVNMRLTGK